MLQFDLTDEHTNLKSVRDFVVMESDDYEWLSEYYSLAFQSVVDGKEVTAESFETEEAQNRYSEFDVDVDFLGDELLEYDENVQRAAQLVCGYIFDFGDVDLESAKIAKKELVAEDDMELFVSCSVYLEDDDLLFALGVAREEQ